MMFDKIIRTFAYDPETGVITNKVRRSANAPKGAVAGCVNTKGYVVIRFDNRLHYAHRIAWLIHYGSEPPKGMDIDHANGDKADNRIDNLRLATRSQNNFNRDKSRTNSSGHRGVSYSKRFGKWRAWVQVEGRMISLGHHATYDEAVAARLDGEVAYYKQFRRQVECAPQ